MTEMENLNLEAEAVQPDAQAQTLEEARLLVAQTADALRAEMAAMVRQALLEMDMTDEERADAREADLAAREKQLARRELRAEALELLGQRGLPAELADALGYEDRAALMAAVDAVERAFRKAVQGAVEERLRGAAPTAGASAQSMDEDALDDADWYALHCGN